MLSYSKGNTQLKKLKVFKLLKNYRSYIFYATSIIISRGLEYFVLFYSALYLSKDTYGELEFYKKIIELLAVALLLAYLVYY